MRSFGLQYKFILFDHYAARSRRENSECNVTHLRSKLECFDMELFNAQLGVDVLCRALSLAKADIQRIIYERERMICSIDQERSPPHLPMEVIAEIAECLRWDSCYGEHSRFGDYSSLRNMANAFSVVEGMEDTILRKIPLVLAHNSPKVANLKEFESNFNIALPTRKRQIIGENPRFNRYDNEEAVSRIFPEEEVHLILCSEPHAANVSLHIFQRLNNIHLTLIGFSDVAFGGFAESFLDSKINP